MPDQPPTFLTGGTVAGNPGGVSCSYLRYVGNFPLWPIVWLIVGTVSIALGATVHWYAFGGLVLAAVGLFLNWLKARLRFRHGDANPGVIINERPVLLAVVGDLSTGGAPWPVVKIVKASARQLAPLDARRGVKVPTIAVYSPPPEKDDSHWSDFDPVPVTCATDRQDEIDRVLQSFGKDEWQMLAAGLKRVPQPYKPGLYPLR